MSKLFSPLMELGAPATLGFATNTLDRAAQLRTKPEAVEALRAADEARFYAFCGDYAVLAKEGAEPLWALSKLPGQGHFREEVFLGIEDAAQKWEPVLGGEASSKNIPRGRFAIAIDPSQEEALKADESLLVIGLRALAFEEMVAPPHLGAIAQGKAMLHWHATHRHCAVCGAPSAVADAGYKRECQACGALHFPRTDPVVIMLAVKDGKALLGRSPRFPPGWYSTLAGFVEPGETIEDAVRRETVEEAGIAVGRVTIMANQPWPFPASLMIGAYCEALSDAITIDHEELEDCRWFSREEIRTMIDGTHPEGLGVPAKMSIASHLIRHFVAG
ncbi:MAG: NAD(+) diphosphatase [Proteobacteria bacterium]|nr:NAD(+) diphosphatase [Pseudomonadota bacterium]